MATDFQRIAFRAAFKTARDHAGLTQRDIADQLGCAPSTVAQWDSGVSAPREELAARLEHLLDVDPGAFRMLLGFAPRDLTIPGVATYAEVVEADHRLRPDQRRLLNIVYDEMTAANRNAEQQARQHAEDLAGQHPDHEPAHDDSIRQQRAEDQAQRRDADDAAIPATTTIDPATSITYDQLPDPAG